MRQTVLCVSKPTSGHKKSRRQHRNAEKRQLSKTRSPRRTSTRKAHPHEAPHHEEHKESPASSTSGVRVIARGSAGPSNLQSSKQGKQASVKPKQGLRRAANNKVLRKTRRHQASIATVIPRRRFTIIAHEILARVTGKNFRMQKLAVEILQKETEAVIVQVMEASYNIAKNSKRKTLMQKDLIDFLSILKRCGGMQEILS
ncbi:histone H3.3 type c-like isoform X2 [Dermacentor albipictus]|uniref:histone H3.3 type c-like isoform X2 n=1 Tax=Dermacentor albipictus TaxID=60249 RepID=UPI0038FD2EE8